MKAHMLVHNKDGTSDGETESRKEEGELFEEEYFQETNTLGCSTSCATT